MKLMDKFPGYFLRRSKIAFENAKSRGMYNPSEWMYMYTKGDLDYFKNIISREYKSFYFFNTNLKGVTA
jgi:hypothetical protein